MISRLRGLAAVLVLLPGALAHSWIDTLSNGVNTGYPRGYVGHIDDAETYKILNQPSTFPLCMASQQDPTKYSTQFPRLKANAGDALTAIYLENGHVTRDTLPPDMKPHPGTYQWFWTGKPFTGSVTDGSQLTTIGETKGMTPLSGPSNFDDGFCAVSSDNTLGRNGPIPCKSNFTIPTGTAPGIYALYWVWNFPKLDTPGYEEIYTTCMDVEVVAGDSSVAPAVSPINKNAVPVAPAAAVNNAPNVNGVETITRTRRHTKTVPGVIVTQTITEGGVGAFAVNGVVDVVVRTIHTQKWVTVTRTAVA